MQGKDFSVTSISDIVDGMSGIGLILLKHNRQCEATEAMDHITLSLKMYQ